MPIPEPKLLRIASFLLLVSAFAAPGAEIVHGTDHFVFNYRTTLPIVTGSGHLWLPLAHSGQFQSVNVAHITAPEKWEQVSDKSGLNQVVVMPVSPADSGKSIEITYTVQRREKESYPAGGNTSAYLGPDRLVPDNATLQAIAQKVVAGRTGPMDRARALYDYVLAQMKYDKTGIGWGHGDAMYACSAKKGNCTDFHSLFIGLARAAGIPARFAIGFTIPANTDSGTIPGYHCWAEFLAGGRWVPVDISEASLHPDLADYYFGHHPANRLELTQGRDLIIDPQPASGPINFLIYPLLEVDGKPVMPHNEFSFRRVKS